MEMNQGLVDRWLNYDTGCIFKRFLSQSSDIYSIQNKQLIEEEACFMESQSDGWHTALNLCQVLCLMFLHRRYLTAI